MSVLTREALCARLRTTEHEERLYITPLLDEKQIGTSSIDVRLGADIIVLDRTMLGLLDLSSSGDSQRQLERFSRKKHVGFRREFILHPGELVLGATLEYVKLPKNLCCAVEGRSSWARSGIVIATATSVDPGFCGCITLEIENLGPVPIRLFPGVRIAQLLFYEAKPPVPYEGRFVCPTGPEVGNLGRDEDLRLFRPQ